MIKRALLLFVAALFLMPGRAWAEEPISLDGLLAEAEAGNPELAAMTKRYEAAWARMPQAGAFEDPMLTLGLLNVPVNSFALDEDSMTSKMVEVSQALPFLGKRALRREAAGHEARSMEFEYMEKRLMVRAEVKKAYYGLYAVRKGLDVVEKNIRLMDVFRKTAEARYSVGKGTLKDVLKAQVEVAMLIEKRLELQREERTNRAFLGSLLGRDAPVNGPVGDLTATKVALDNKTLAGTASGSRPAVKAAEAKVREGSAMVELARKGYYPDFTVSASYMQRETLQGGMRQSDMVSAAVSVNVPLWWGTKREPAVREAESDKGMAEKGLAVVKNDIYYKVDSLAGEIEQDDRILKLYKDTVIPQGTEDLNAALAGYEVGRSDFLDLLDSRRTLYEYELGYYNMLAEREKAVAELEAATGVEFK